MDDQLLQVLATFVGGMALGAAIILIWNKLRAGSASPANLKQEYEDYKNQVEEHFEETSQRFKEMTEQYQDLYRHLSKGATTLCRPDSVAASLADDSLVQAKLEQKTESDPTVVAEQAESSVEAESAAESDVKTAVETDAEAEAVPQDASAEIDQTDSKVDEKG